MFNSYLPVDSPNTNSLPKKLHTQKNFAVVAVVVKVTTTFLYNYRIQLSRYRGNEGKFSLTITSPVTLKTVGQFSMVFSTIQKAHFGQVIAQFT